MSCPDLVNKKGCDLEIDFEYDFVDFAAQIDCLNRSKHSKT